MTTLQLVRAVERALRLVGTSAVLLGLASPRAMPQARGNAGSTSRPTAERTLIPDREYPLLRALTAQTVWSVAVGSDGRVVAAPRAWYGAKIIATDSTGTRELWSLPVGRGDEFEVSGSARLSWRDRTLVVYDPGFSHFALVDPNGRVTRSEPFPAMLRPKFADRRKYPMFGGVVSALAWYADGSMLVRPVDPVSLVDTPEYDRTRSLVVRVGENRVIERTVASVPRERVFTADGRAGSFGLPAPTGTDWLLAINGDGSRLAVVIPNYRGKDSATVRVTSVRASGDTVFSALVPYAPVAWSVAAIDSLRTRLPRRGPSDEEDEELSAARAARGEAARGATARGTTAGGATAMRNSRAREAFAAQLPPARSPVLSALVAHDRSTWLEMRAAPGERGTRRYVVLDSLGKVLAPIRVPDSVTITVAGPEHVWGWAKTGSGTAAKVSLVRYRVSK